MSRRLLLDVSSLVRWSGPPVGISRVEHALALGAARRCRAALVVFDRTTSTYRALRPEWQDALTGWSGILEDPADDPSRRGWRAWVPSRKPVVSRLERWRLTWPFPASRVADLAQLGVLGLRRHGTPVHDAAGGRVARVPADLALGAEIRPGRGDVLFSAGSGWAHADPDALAALKRRDGFRVAALCYDLIPLTHPCFWAPEVARTVRRYWLAQLPLTDLIVVNAHCIADDVRRVAAENGIATPIVAVLPLGYDPPPPGPTPPLPAGLEPGRFVLFVSTVEPRKGHVTLLRAWRGLLARGIPQRHGFRLVFVGRAGWMVEDVLAELASFRDGSVLHLQGVGGPALEAMYQTAAFCLYPSVYEGFGLPVIEAFARGKAIIASTGGALPETVGDLSPCLPPGDAAAWEEMIAAWITDPAARAPWEARIRTGFSHPDWATAAGAILDTVAALASAEGGPEAEEQEVQARPRPEVRPG